MFHSVKITLNPYQGLKPTHLIPLLANAELKSP